MGEKLLSESLDDMVMGHHVAERAREIARRLDDDPRTMSNAWAGLRNASDFDDFEAVALILYQLEYEKRWAYMEELRSLVEQEHRDRPRAKTRARKAAGQRQATTEWVPVRRSAAGPTRQVLGHDEDGVLVVDDGEGRGAERVDGSGRPPLGKVTSR
jgi:hypothetical protein